MKKNKKNKKIISCIAAVALIISIVVLSGCSSLSRAVKDINSDVSGGLDRTITVYNYNGEVLTTYEGKIDIASESEDRVKFDLDGKRYIIYNAPTIIEEK